jgi:hypothetical protein
MCLSLLFVAGVIASSSRQPPSPATSASVPAQYTPGLSEIMTLQQMRHTKLWLSAEAGNWSLAAYELKELGAMV